MLHPSHGNISKCPVVWSMNKTRDPLASCQVSCFLKLLRMSRNISTDHVSLWQWAYTINRHRICEKRLRKLRGTRCIGTPPCHARAQSCQAACRVVYLHAFMFVHMQKHCWRSGVRKACVSSPLPSVSLNLQDCGACLRMCACVRFTSLCFVWYF